MTSRSRATVPTALLLVAAVATFTVVGTQSADARPIDPDRPSVTSQDIDVPAHAGQVVVTIGDSIMNGHGVDDDQSWPDLLADRSGWQLTNLSTDGAGFISPGDDGTVLQDQVDEAATLDPALVIISASSNDLGEDADDLDAATESTMLSLHESLPNAQIIALSAIWGDTEAPPELADINDDLEAATELVGGSYLDIGEPLIGKPWMMQFDDMHPTAEGLQILADRIDAAMDADSLPSPEGSDLFATSLAQYEHPIPAVRYPAVVFE